MRISKAFPETEIYLVEDLVSLSKLIFLQDFYDGKKKNLGGADQYVESIVNEVALKIQQAMIETYTHMDNPTFKVKNLMQLHDRESLHVHFDGVPMLGAEEQPENVAAVFYINDNFKGGETFYPNLGVSYRPVPGNALMHPGKPGYEHGVSEVHGSTRHSFTVFAYNNYNGSVDF